MFNLKSWAIGTHVRKIHLEWSLLLITTKIQMYHCIHWFWWNGIIFYEDGTLFFPLMPSSCSAKTFCWFTVFPEEQMDLLDVKVESDVNMADGETEHKIQPVWLQGIQWPRWFTELRCCQAVTACSLINAANVSSATSLLMLGPGLPGVRPGKKTSLGLYSCLSNCLLSSWMQNYVSLSQYFQFSVSLISFNKRSCLDLNNKSMFYTIHGQRWSK